MLLIHACARATVYRRSHWLAASMLHWPRLAGFSRSRADAGPPWTPAGVENVPLVGLARLLRERCVRARARSLRRPSDDSELAGLEAMLRDVILDADSRVYFLRPMFLLADFRATPAIERPTRYIVRGKCSSLYGERERPRERICTMIAAPVSSLDASTRWPFVVTKGLILYLRGEVFGGGKDRPASWNDRLHDRISACSHRNDSSRVESSATLQQVGDSRLNAETCTKLSTVNSSSASSAFSW